MNARAVAIEDLLAPLTDAERKHAPHSLFLAGDAQLVTHARCVSIVGSRAATGRGLGRARRLAQELVARDIVVVSGLAEGIDTAAHEEAISAGGRTVAVLGTPLDQCYPAKNRALLEAIKRDHLAVSQFAPGSAGGPRRFPMRNRTMALLSDATVIIEAGEGSGSLHQGWEALRLGRLLCIAQAVVKDPALTWPAEMLRYGAQVLSNSTLEAFFDSLPVTTRAERAELAL